MLVVDELESAEVLVVRDVRGVSLAVAAEVVNDENVGAAAAVEFFDDVAADEAGSACDDDHEKGSSFWERSRNFVGFILAYLGARRKYVRGAVCGGTRRKCVRAGSELCPVDSGMLPAWSGVRRARLLCRPMNGIPMGRVPCLAKKLLGSRIPTVRPAKSFLMPSPLRPKWGSSSQKATSPST